MLSELLCSNGGIIRVPEGAKYTREDAIAVITYAATSTANSPEAAVSELKRKMPNVAIPSADTVFKYRFVDKRSPDFYLVAIPNPDYDPKDDKKKAEFHLFATSINFGSVEEFVKRVPEEYRRRWNIETGYRVKNNFKIRTCSKKGVARVLFFVVQSVMHNFLNVQKSILSITAYELKSLITEDIQKYLCVGKFANTVSLSEFYTRMASYNERRVIELRCQLAAS